MKKLTRAALAAALTAGALSAAAGSAGPAAATHIPSSNCDAGLQVWENTTQGVHTKVYTLNSPSNVVRVCVRVEQLPAGTGKGGEFVITTGTPSHSITGVQTPGSDGNHTACTATTPNMVPGTHPISSGGVLGVPYAIDAALQGTTAQVCVRAGTDGVRVVVPVAVPTVSVNPGNSVVFNPDPGT